MTSERKKNTANRLIKIADNLLSPEIYQNNKVRRGELASYYRKFMNLESVFPKIPASKGIPSKLDSRISKTCGDCVTPENMKIYIADAIRFIQNSAKKLQEMIDEIQPEEIKSVHDLEPRKNK